MPCTSQEFFFSFILSDSKQGLCVLYNFVQIVCFCKRSIMFSWFGVRCCETIAYSLKDTVLINQKEAVIKTLGHVLTMTSTLP